LHPRDDKVAASFVFLSESETPTASGPVDRANGREVCESLLKPVGIYTGT